MAICRDYLRVKRNTMTHLGRIDVMLTSRETAAAREQRPEKNCPGRAPIPLQPRCERSARESDGIVPRDGRGGDEEEIRVQVLTTTICY